MKGIWQYRKWLHPFDADHTVSLGEGNTPLIRSGRIAEKLGLQHLYFKMESLNPSGSYKDRFAAMVVSDLKQKNTGFCIATSSGNTGSALAAYCAAAGIQCFLVITDGAPTGKVQQMRLYGAEILMVKNFGLDPQITEQVMNRLNRMAAEFGTSVQISAYKYNAQAMQGVQTIAWEIAAELPTGLAHVFSPAGGGGLTLAIANGFLWCGNENPALTIPRVHCVQPQGNDTISHALRQGLACAQAVPKSLTAISGLQVPNVIDGTAAIQACRKTKGNGYSVFDEMIFESQQWLATYEGICCEPAGAVALAGLRQALIKNEVAAHEKIVCLVTGHGFKDPASMSKMAESSEYNYYENSEDAFQRIKMGIDTCRSLKI